MSENEKNKLQGLEFELPIKLKGKLDILRNEKGLPIVFLFDEHHENLNGCIDKNIEDAIELIEKGNIVKVGVESLAGGKSWDSTNQKYSEDYDEKKYDEYLAARYKNTCLKFVNEIGKDSKSLICGLECFGMIHKIQKDLSEDTEYRGTDVALHPLNKARSKHFIQTLFQNFTNNGNLILNCGSNHNDHIVEWIRSGEIDKITGVKASYVRINNF